MLGDGYLERFRQAFAAQFRLEDDRLVYRRDQKGPSVPVSEAERDGFVAAFTRRMRGLFWGLIAGMAALMLAGAVAAASIEGELSELVIWGVVLAPIAVFTPLVFRTWSAPARALAGRTPAGPPVDPRAHRRRAFAGVTWSGLLVASATPVVLLFQVSRDHDLAQGWNRLWLVGAAGFWAFVGVQAFRKWRADRGGAP